MLNKQRNLRCLLFTVPNYISEVGFYNYIEPTIVQLIDIILENQKKNAKDQEDSLVVMIVMLMVTVMLASMTGIVCLVKLG